VAREDAHAHVKALRCAIKLRRLQSLTWWQERELLAHSAESATRQRMRQTEAAEKEARARALTDSSGVKLQALLGRGQGASPCASASCQLLYGGLFNVQGLFNVWRYCLCGGNYNSQKAPIDKCHVWQTSALQAQYVSCAPIHKQIY